MLTLTPTTGQDMIRASDERVAYALRAIGTRALHVGRKSSIILRRALVLQNRSIVVWWQPAGNDFPGYESGADTGRTVSRVRPRHGIHVGTVEQSGLVSWGHGR